MKALSRLVFVAGVAGTALVAAALPAHAATGSVERVVLAGHSIQQAVDAAKPGDVILLRKGHYTGGVVITKSWLTIVGDGAGTVIEPGATNACAMDDSPPAGICVGGDPSHPVRGVTIRDLTVRGFDGFGVFGFGTDRFTVTKVWAVNNSEYGIVEFASTRGAFVSNAVTGSSEEAGLYVGDIADSHGTVVKDNWSSNNALGLLVRHAHGVTVSGNNLIGNCTGIALVDDGQDGSEGDNHVTDNLIKGNNNNCPPHEEVPPLHGTGIFMVGGQRNLIEHNAVLDNAGPLPYSGGVALVPGVSGRPASDNRIVFNVIQRNKPANVVDNSGSHTNTIAHNILG
jgi:nitrous oxidase accessory protein NosD